LVDKYMRDRLVLHAAGSVTRAEVRRIVARVITQPAGSAVSSKGRIRPSPGHGHCPTNGKKPLAIGGGPEGVPYILANLLAEMALTGLRWEVVNLGPNTPLPSFRSAVARTRTRLLWLSASHLVDTASFLERCREMYREASRMGTAVAIGGQAQTHELRAQMPYTTFGDGLTHLVGFARSFQSGARRPRRGRPRGA
jgi:hypothetical protein